MSNDANAKSRFAASYIQEVHKCLESVSLQRVAELIAYLEEAYRQRKHVFVMGNGGSAATASHLACDLAKNIFPPEAGETVQRFGVMSLTDNVAWMTALANDLDYEFVFSEQLRTLAQPGDLVVVISGSGNSPNIVRAARVAKELETHVVGILGFDGGMVKDLLDTYVLVPSNNYGCVEDLHLMLGHIVTSYFKSLYGTEEHTRLLTQFVLPAVEAAPTNQSAGAVREANKVSAVPDRPAG